MYMVHLWLTGKLVVDFPLVLIEQFCQLSQLRCYQQILVEIVLFERCVGHFEHKFQGEEGSSTNEFWRHITRVPGLSLGVFCVMLCLAVLIQYRHVLHGHTHRHALMPITRTSLAPLG